MPILLIVLIMGACSNFSTSAVDRLFEAYQGDDVPGAAVLVIRDGERVVNRTYGMADLERGVPVRPNTNFRLASVTKQFTAMAVLQLVQQGALDLDRPLRDLFPDFPAFAERITVRHLLQHTSGLVDYESLIPDTATVQVVDRDVLGLLVRTDSTYFEPGTAYRYSNSGYAVLAMVVEGVSGRSYSDFLRTHIFDPLGMDETVVFQDGISSVAHRAYGYTVEDGGVSFSDQSVTSAVLGDGGVYSSIDDLYRWDRALYGEDLVSGDLLAEAFTPGLEGYGFGWRIDTFEGRRRMHHTGSTRGFRTAIQRFPDARLTVVVLTNRNGPAVGDRAETLARMYLPPITP